LKQEINLWQERGKRRLLLAAGSFDGGAGRPQPGAVLLGERDGVGQRERRWLGLDTRVEG
jgi:hypothetical protein